MRWTLWVSLLAYALPTGCASDSPLPLDPPSAPDSPMEEVDWIRDDGRLHYVTPGGKLVQGVPIADGGVRFWIEDGSRVFGFELAETHLYEWAIEDGVKHDLRIEYGGDSGVVEYVANGRPYTRLREEIPRFEAAKSMADGRAFFHEGQGLDYTSHRVYRNELGDELVRVLAERNADLALREGESSGRCSTWLMAATGGCALAKCPFGGALNPVCVGCTGAFLGCLAVAMYSRLT